MRDETRTFWWLVRWGIFWSLVGLVFGFSLCCKSPVSPDIDLEAPTIEYFTSTKEFIYSGIVDSTALQWRTQNADSCNISPGIGEVDTNSPAPLWVSPEYTTTYVLTAKNDAGSARAEVRVEVRPWLPCKLTLRLDPEYPVFDYNPTSGKTLGYFTSILTEHNDVGGQINKFIVSAGGDWGEHTPPGDIGPLGTLSVSCTLYTSGKPSYMMIIVEGGDYHGFDMYFSWYFTIIWDGNTGQIAPS